MTLQWEVKRLTGLWCVQGCVQVCGSVWGLSSQPRCLHSDISPDTPGPGSTRRSGGCGILPGLQWTEGKQGAEGWWCGGSDMAERMNWWSEKEEKQVTKARQERWRCEREKDMRCWIDCRFTVIIGWQPVNKLSDLLSCWSLIVWKVWLLFNF